ncbi:hypothetical protein KXR53_05875 [Inquilinus limosus]|uniref:hypothetical protein n=1 Tax=Inquilinus limosus TaxID=171674 RepID=UPI003F138E3B
MAEPVCRNRLCRIAELPMLIADCCVRAAAIIVIAIGLADHGHAQMPAQPQIPLQEPDRPPSTPTPTHPLVKPGLPLPEPGIGQPALPPPVERPAPVTIHVQQSKTHPNGMTISVTTVSLLPSSIAIAVEIFNPAADWRRLNPLSSLLLTDDRGRSYPFLPPPDNPEMLISPRSRVTGQLVFLGPVDWQARLLRLSINHPNGSPTDRMTATPLFQFSLPAEPRS